MATFPSSFRWIHIGPDDDVEPYGGGPEVRGGGPGAAVAQQARPPWRRVGCSHLQCTTRTVQPPLPHPTLHSELSGLALMRATDAWTFAMRGGESGFECNATRVCPSSSSSSSSSSRAVSRLQAGLLSVQPEQGPVQVGSCQSDLSAVVVAGSSDQRPF